MKLIVPSCRDRNLQSSGAFEEGKTGLKGSEGDMFSSWDYEMRNWNPFCVRKWGQPEPVNTGRGVYRDYFAADWWHAVISRAWGRRRWGMRKGDSLHQSSERNAYS